MAVFSPDAFSEMYADPKNDPRLCMTMFGDFIKDSGDWGTVIGRGAVNTSGTITYANNSIWTNPSDTVGGVVAADNASTFMILDAASGPTFGVATLSPISTASGRLSGNQAAFSNNTTGTNIITYGQLMAGYGRMYMESRVKCNAAAAVAAQYRVATGFARWHGLTADPNNDDAITWVQRLDNKWSCLVSRSVDTGDGFYTTNSYQFDTDIPCTNWNTLAVEVEDESKVIRFTANGKLVLTVKKKDSPSFVPDRTSQMKFNAYCGIMEGGSAAAQGEMYVDYSLFRYYIQRNKFN